ncbi:MAG: hypothetical protein R3C44_06545 [Chloroflexota bacterium]
MNSDFALTNDWLAARAAASPDTVALVDGRTEWSYQALDELVTKQVSGLTIRGSAETHTGCAHAELPGICGTDSRANPGRGCTGAAESSAES